MCADSLKGGRAAASAFEVVAPRNKMTEGVSCPASASNVAKIRIRRDNDPVFLAGAQKNGFVICRLQAIVADMDRVVSAL